MTEREIVIDGQRIGPGYPPYIIAEMSANHNGSLDRAMAIIKAAKAAGASAVKLQSYSADTMTIPHDGPGFVIREGLWKGRTLYDLYREAAMPWDWHSVLFRYAKEIGITIFSTPFDDSAVDLLEKLGAPAYKIASFEAIDLPLISYVAATRKPMIISTGMASLEEIAEAVDTARKAGCSDLALLHCVSAYPADPAAMNLRTLRHLSETFDVVAGLSDHTLGTEISVAAVALGACVIEKHFMLRRCDGGPDSAFSLEPDEMRQLVTTSRNAWAALGQVSYRLAAGEDTMVEFRRSLYVVADMAAGELFSAANVRAIRPGLGLAPAYLPKVMGCRARRAIARGTALKLEMIDGLD